MTGPAPWPQAGGGNLEFTKSAVTIIGAGMSGMCLAIDLLNRGITNFVILEKSAGVGGTWRDNKYPGCACDSEFSLRMRVRSTFEARKYGAAPQLAFRITGNSKARLTYLLSSYRLTWPNGGNGDDVLQIIVWSVLYSYSFAQKSTWSRLYPGQEEILAYLLEIAAKYNLYQYIRFNSSVQSATWDHATNTWKTAVRVSGEKDSEFYEGYSIESDFLITAVGQLNQPSWPTIPGLETFTGKMMHSARWDWTYDLAGKRIAVIGNGATAVQITPELAKVAKKLTIYQRTPNWVTYRMDQAVPRVVQSLFKWCPPSRWLTRSLMMDMREGFYGAVADSGGKVSNEIRSQCLQAIEKSFPGEENAAIREALTPKYSPLCKRVIISDDFYPALARDNVVLETRSVKAITETGILMDDGNLEDCDLIICATGFKTTQFLHPIHITGEGGKSLEEVWTDGAQALYGMTVESMPNFGCLYGPNTNLGHNSVVLMIEQQTRYINTLVERVLQTRAGGDPSFKLVPKRDRIEAYNANLQKQLQTTVFADPSCNSWYKTADGKIINNWSDSVVAYQKLLSTVDWSDFEGGEQAAKKNSQEYIGRVREESLVSLSQLKTLSIVGVLLGAAAVAAKKFPKGIRL